MSNEKMTNSEAVVSSKVLTDSVMSQIDYWENEHLEEITKSHVSVSQLRTWSSCELKHYFKYDLHLKIKRPAKNLVVGGLIHEAIAQYKLALWKDQRPNENVLFAGLEEAIERSQKDLEVVCKTAKEFQSTKLHMQMMLAAYYKKVKGTFGSTPITFLEHETGKEKPSVELECRIPIVNLFSEERELITDRVLVAYIDEISKNGKFGVAIMDHKTARSEWKKFKLETDIQLAAYAYIFRYLAMHGHFPYDRTALDGDVPKEDCAGFNFIYKTKEPRVQIKTFTVDDWQIELFYKLVKEMEHRQETLQFVVPSFVYEHYSCCQNCEFSIGRVGTQTFRPEESICMQHLKGATADDLREIASKVNAINAGGGGGEDE